jgi:hypothetical protein
VIDITEHQPRNRWFQPMSLGSLILEPSRGVTRRRGSHDVGTAAPRGEFITRRKAGQKGRRDQMKSLLVRRKHVDLDQALTAMSDPTIPARDTLVMWRKALRRANGPTKKLLRRVKLPPKKRGSISLA